MITRKVYSLCKEEAAEEELLNTNTDISFHDLNWATSNENLPSSMRTMCRFASSFTRTKCNPGYLLFI